MKFDEDFVKERTEHLEKIPNMDYEFFLFFCRLNWSIVNTDQESTVASNITYRPQIGANDTGRCSLII
jgi:hypothetical protein